MKRISFITILCLISFVLLSQKGELGIYGGVVYYVGDINPARHFLLSKPAFGILYRYNINTRLTLRAGGSYGTLKADDIRTDFIPERQLKFSSKIYDLSVIMELNFLDYFTGSTKSYVTTYIFGGFCAFHFNPQADGVKLRNIGTEGQNDPDSGREKYSLISFGMPFGLGVKYSFTKRLAISLEWGIRKTITDYIDDVSTTYYFEEGNPQQNSLSDPTGTFGEGMQRGNSQDNDWYNFSGLILTYKFSLSKSFRCIDFQERPSF